MVAAVVKRTETLAEYLGVVDPRTPSTPPASAVDLSTLSAKKFFQFVVRSPEYRQSILNRIVLGELPAAVEVTILHYAHGKPVERVEVEDVTPKHAEDWSEEQLENRAMVLLEYARRLRMAKAEQPSSDEDGAVSTHSIH